MPRPTASDLLIILISAAVALGALFLAAGGSGPVLLEVKTPEGSFLESLDQDATLSFKGDLGSTLVRISGGEAAVISSPCANQFCVHSPPIDSPGEWIACLPNRVMIKIRGGRNEGDVDAGSW